MTAYRWPAFGVSLWALLMGWVMHDLVVYRNAAVRDAGWLRQRLVEKRALVRALQSDLTVVAAATERVAQMASMARNENAVVRSLVNVEWPPQANYTPARLALLDEAARNRSEDAGRALEQLAFLEDQLAETTDSLALLIALGRPSSERARMTPAVAVAPEVVDGARPTGWPVRGEVSSRFGWRDSPYGHGTQRHTGLDIIADYGTPVAASAAGTVVFAGRDDGGYGTTVVVDHGHDVKTLYGHLSAVYVRDGQRIARGAVVGAVGNSGRATGVHLHYEVRVGNVPVDPMKYTGGVEHAAFVSR
jgi:murein DD-endopeptidase MepM/ murein hydrolase activator NlpD